MKKSIAISILEDIRDTLSDNENGIEKGLRDIEIYRKDLEISINPKINKMIKIHKEYIMKYGEYGRKTLKISKKIDEEIQKIVNN